MQTENRQQLSTITEELSSNQENVQKLNLCNDELNKLLAEAKTTMIELQVDLKTAKEKIETLQQQNDRYARELVEMKSKGAVGESVPPAIPLEPIVIVDSKANPSTKKKRTRPQSSVKVESGHRTQPETNSSDDNDSSEDVDTYVV